MRAWAHLTGETCTMKKVCLCCFLLLMFSAVRAEDLVLKSGKVYRNFQVHKAVSSGLAITHDDGVATVPYAELPDALRGKYLPPAQAAAPASSATSGAAAPAPAAPAPAAPVYWQSAGSKKVHNSSCRYYRRSSGEMVSGLNGGTDCKLCGGTKASGAAAPAPAPAAGTPSAAPAPAAGLGDAAAPKEIKVGPRGGRYYIDSQGKKVYIRKKK